MCRWRVPSGSSGEGSGPEGTARVGAPEGLVKSCIIIPFVGDTGDVRLLPETELWMAFTIPGCTNGVLARAVVRSCRASASTPIEGAMLNSESRRM